MNAFGRKKMDSAMRDITALGGGFLTAFFIALSFLGGYERVAVALIIGYVLVYSIASLIRVFYYKDRPKPEKYENIIERVDASSFPSIHTSNAFYIAFILHDFAMHPIFSVFVFLSAALVGYTRIYLEKHFMIDVVVGAVLGLISGFAAVTYILPAVMPVL